MHRAEPHLIPTWVLPALVVLILSVLAVGALQARGAVDTTEQLATATQAGSQAATKANDLASTIAAACSAGTIPPQYADACVKARRVVAAPVPGPEGPIGATGPAGADGSQGPAGLAGPTGAEGSAGPAGPAGQDGKDGANGQDGAPGAVGPQGPAGPPGCDAGTARDATGACVPSNPGRGQAAGDGL